MKKIMSKFSIKAISGIFLSVVIGAGIMCAQPAPPPGAPGLPNPAPPAESLPPGPPPPNNPMLPPNNPGAPLQTPMPPNNPGAPAQTPPPPGWGGPGFLSSVPPDQWMNQGTINVMATGYDTESVMVQIPLVVSYNYNGVNYNVTVDNAWNPYTQTWSIGVDVPAYSTSYFFNGFTYNYYASLAIGTFYFNL